MDEDQNAKRLDAVRASLDDAAKYVGTLYLTFLLASMYIAITVGSTNDEQLLRESSLPLPLLGVGLPVKAFYIVIPVVLVLLHLHLLLHIYFLSRKAADFERLSQSFTSAAAQEQKRLLFPLIISPITARAYPSFLIRCSLRIVTYSTVIVGPVLLLLLIQTRFLPFHAVSVTMWQRICLLADVMAIWLIWWRIFCITASVRKPWNIGKPLRWLAAGVTTLGVVTFSLCIASVPKESLDLQWSLFDRCRQPLHRQITVTDNTIVAEPPSPQLIALYLQHGHTEEEAWRKHAKGIPLRGRDLRGVDLSYSRLYNADFRGSNLDDSTFVEATLEGARFDEAHDGNGHASLKRANLAAAKMRGARLAEVELEGANLEGTDLCDADLDMAQLAGAFMRHARMNGASLEAAHLEAAYAPGIELKAAHLNRAHFEVAALTQGDLRGATLREVDVKGADLVQAKLQGADLTGANVSGANLDGADLELSDLEELQAKDLSAVDVKDLEEDLSIYFERPKVKNALKRLGIPDTGVRTRFGRANFAGAFYGPELTEKIENLPALAAKEEYLQSLVIFLSQLACADSCIGKTFIDKAARPYSRLEVLLAEVLLKARGNKNCPGLERTSNEEWKNLLDAIGQSDPRYREPNK